MATINRPLINGFLHSFAQVEIDIGGAKFFPKALNYKQSLSQNAEFGSGVLARGRSLGQYTASADVELFSYEYGRLIAALGNGYATKSFNIGAQFKSKQLGLFTIEIEGATIIDDEPQNMQQGGTGTSHKLPLSIIMPIKINGYTMVEIVEQRLAVPSFVIGASASLGLG